MVCEPPKPRQPRLLIRKFRNTDPVPEITALLHRAYKPLADRGLRFHATYQDDQVTRDRLARGEAYVGILDGSLVATVTLYGPKPGACAWYARPEVAHFGQLAVEPALQGRGLGASLMALVESRARERGFAELALDTAEGASHLIAHYGKRGYRLIEHVQWDPSIVNYRSVVLSKKL